MPTFEASRHIPDASPQQLHDWHMRPGAFERLAPPWQDIEVVRRDEPLQSGSRLEFRIRQGGVPLTWVARHEGFVEGEQFVDVMERGPFASWRHVHRFEPAPHDAPGSLLRDTVTYSLPAGPVGQLAGGAFTRETLEQMFAFRHRRTAQDLARHAQFAARGPQRIAITGASGLIGQNLSAFLTTGGHEVLRLVRSREEAERYEDAVYWKPSADEIDAARLEGLDAVVHLAGEPIADGRWTDDKMRRVERSRQQGTGLVARTIAALERPPRVLLSASAIGYYGDTGDRVVTEEEPAGDLFISRVCRQWEEAAVEPLAGRDDVRVTQARIGLVTTPQGGFLGEMLLPFKLGMGGRLAGGDQWWSWIALDDLVYALHFLLFADDLHGPVNLVAPEPVTNAAFTDTLGRVLHRPTVATVPGLALKAAFGSQKARELLLAGQRVLPARLQEAGFGFSYPDLEEALRFLFGKASATSTPG